MKPEFHLHWVKIYAGERTERGDIRDGFPDPDLISTIPLFGQNYFSCIKPETIERHKFGKLTGDGELSRQPSEHSITQRPGQLVLARMITGDYSKDPDFGIAFRYAEIACDAVGAYTPVISVDVFRKPLPFELIKDGAPDNIRLRQVSHRLFTSWNFKPSFSGDSELGNIVREVYRGCETKTSQKR